MSKLFPDDKDFVDMPLRMSQGKWPALPCPGGGDGGCVLSLGSRPSPCSSSFPLGAFLEAGGACPSLAPLGLAGGQGALLQAPPVCAPPSVAFHLGVPTVDSLEDFCADTGSAMLMGTRGRGCRPLQGGARPGRSSRDLGGAGHQISLGGALFLLQAESRLGHCGGGGGCCLAAQGCGGVAWPLP